MKSPLETAQKRTRRYWYEDGLSELAAGAVILLMALLNLAIALVAPPHWQGWLSAAGLPEVGPPSAQDFYSGWKREN